MAYGQYRNTGVRVLHDYMSALNKFNNTKPIRGRTDVSRPMYPLGHRHRIDSFWIAKCPLTQDVECNLYRTPVVTYQSNGNIKIKSDGWDTISTANFIDEVLGINAYIFDHNLCISFWNQDGREEYRVPSGESLTIRRENGRYVYVSGAPNNVIHSVSRKAANAVRKQYKDFKQYALAMIKLRDGAFGIDETTEALGEKHVPSMKYSWSYDSTATWIGKCKDWMGATHEDKHNDYYKALLLMVRTFGGWTSRITLQEFEAGFNYMTLGFHRSEVLVEEVLPMGVVKKDNYGKYFRRAWNKYHAG